MNFYITQNVGNFSTSWGPISFSRTQTHELVETLRLHRSIGTAIGQIYKDGLRATCICRRNGGTQNSDSSSQQQQTASKEEFFNFSAWLAVFASSNLYTSFILFANSFPDP